MLSRKKLRNEIIEIIDEMAYKPVYIDSDLTQLNIDFWKLEGVLELKYSVVLSWMRKYYCWDTVQDVINDVGNALIEQGYKFNEAEEDV